MEAAGLGPEGLKGLGPRAIKAAARLEELAIDEGAALRGVAWGSLSASGPNGLLILMDEHLAFVAPAPGPLRVWSLRGLEGGGPRPPLQVGASWSTAAQAGGRAEAWRLEAPVPEAAPAPNASGPAGNRPADPSRAPSAGASPLVAGAKRFM
jgi:hypothetical protein